MDVVSEAVAVMGEQIAILSKACDELSHRELIRLMAEVNAVMRSVPAVEHRALGRLVAETEPHHLGEASWKKVLTTALRVSGREAARRLVRAKTLGPRRAVGGEPLAPLWEATATAQANKIEALTAQVARLEQIEKENNELKRMIENAKEEQQKKTRTAKKQADLPIE